MYQMMYDEMKFGLDKKLDKILSEEDQALMNKTRKELLQDVENELMKASVMNKKTNSFSIDQMEKLLND
jgi:hypothetical protein